MNIVELNPKNSTEHANAHVDTACDNCRVQNECDVLNTALVVLKSKLKLESDAFTQSEYDAFMKQLKDYGFNYEHAIEPCWLADKGSVLRDLTDEAIRILNEHEYRHHRGQKTTQE